MQISIVVEPVSGAGFRALSGPPWAVETAAATREEAVEKLRSLISSRVQAGAEVQVVTLDLPIANHPLAKYAGTLKDDPLLEAWKEAMAEYRRAREAEDLEDEAS